MFLKKIAYILKECTNLDDEICNGSPNVWKDLRQSYLNCPMPCKFISYGLSEIDVEGNLYSDGNENEVTIGMSFMQQRKITTEVLLYDVNDMIGAIGGSLGLFLGFSFFHSLSLCMEKFLDLFSPNH